MHCVHCSPLRFRADSCPSLPSALSRLLLQRLGDRVKLIRGVVREVTGYAPYEKRLMEILRGGGNNPTKKAWKFAKNRLGTHVRAKRKVAEMGDVIASAKKAEAQAKAAATAAAAQQKAAAAGK